MVMPEQSANQSRAPEQSARAERSAGGTRAAVVISLLCIALVWAFGCVWSFEEQSDFATLLQFRIPWILPVVIDGFAFSLAAVAFAASLDGRSALAARLTMVVAVGSSATSNGVFAWQRSDGNTATLAVAVGIPIVANLAFEVLLVEVRKQVMRRRGIPAPVALPYPRWQQMVLSPFRTFWQWRRLVLAALDLAPLFEAAQSAAQTTPERRRSALPPTPDAPAPAKAPALIEGQTEQSAPRKSAPPSPARHNGVRRRSAPTVALHIVGTEHSSAAIENARVLRDHYGDDLPERGAHAAINRDLGWGGSKATNAIKAYRERADEQPAETPETSDDDKEREPALTEATA